MKKIQIVIFLFTSVIGIAQTNLLAQTAKNKTSIWFTPFDFNLSNFQKPPQSYAPMARWWWPGNDVTKEELKREINLFADNGFAGVEVQPMNLAIPMRGDVRQRVTNWDTPEYYDNLRTVMEEARKRNLIVDVTDGSGWPPGGPFLNPEDGFLSLEFSVVTVSGGKKITIPLPRVKNNSTVPSRLQAVVASRIQEVKTGNTTTSTNTKLDASTTSVLTSFVKNDTLIYTFPEGQWSVIAFWAIPSGEQTNIAASPKQGPVVNHFDSIAVLKLYNHLFGERTGLQPYYGNPFRAVFNDSYEFKANRHYSLDFLSYFKQQRGYDITPYLPANMQKGYNFVAYMRPNAEPDFSFTDQDWRLRYDYDITLGELLGEHFFKASKNYLESRDLLHRTQGYGLNMDMIGMAGLASIPETESMLGSEANIKIMTSGGHLYNRPIISAESVVFGNQAYTTTPQKIKLAVDKLFAAGVNQVIYHGIPYRYLQEKLGPEGWYPFSSPFLTMINFSSNLGEGNIFWKDQKRVNEYVCRVQYALRSGKPHTDVLIYFPFLNVEGMPVNPEEIFTEGSLDELKAYSASTGENKTPKEAWAEKVYLFINQLEANGITWNWVNDASIQEATIGKDGQLTIRGNQFQALILANDSIIQLKTAQQIKLLADKGMRLLITDALPNKQPSYLNWKENDAKTAQSISAALKTKNSCYLNQEKALLDWIRQLHQPLAFQQPYHFTRQVEREMGDGSRVRFIWNKSNHWQTYTLVLNKRYKSSYWLNPDNGIVTKNEGLTITYQLPPYGSIILYAVTKNNKADDRFVTPSISIDTTKTILAVNNWNLKTDSVEIKDTALFDWKNNQQLKFSSSEAVYTATFQWQQSVKDKHFFLDLGKVCYTAEVHLNGQLVGKRIYAPYLLDITSFLKQGTNEITVHLTPGQLNGFIGKANNGDIKYKQFRGKNSQIMSAGLIGPVVIRQEKFSKF
ncbi:MAG: glycosyl hydrolase family 2 [Bacteroidales bacterium]|nr:glycosyl hydrolase family 2 [Bacteroidales bacterium]